MSYRETIPEEYLGTMLGYVLHFVQLIDGKETSLYFRCMAENDAHALEQLENAETGILFSEIIKREK